MDFSNLGVQIGIVLAALLVLWLAVKTLKFVWKLLIIILIIAIVSLAFPSARQWILSFF